jgi:hypothetical protein
MRRVSALEHAPAEERQRNADDADALDFLAEIGWRRSED